MIHKPASLSLGLRTASIKDSLKNMCGEEVGVVEDVPQLVQADDARRAADGDHAGVRAPDTHTLQTQTTTRYIRHDSMKLPIFTEPLK